MKSDFGGNLSDRRFEKGVALCRLSGNGGFNKPPSFRGLRGTNPESRATTSAVVLAKARTHNHRPPW
jgi:hypothetical protein